MLTSRYRLAYPNWVPRFRYHLNPETGLLPLKDRFSDTTHQFLKETVATAR